MGLKGFRVQGLKGSGLGQCKERSKEPSESWGLASYELNPSMFEEEGRRVSGLALGFRA